MKQKLQRTERERFKKIELSPKRLTAYLDISKQFLAQDSLSTDAMMTSDLARAIAIKLQRTILSKDAHDEKRPDGFFTGTPEYKSTVWQLLQIWLRWNLQFRSMRH